MVGPDSTPLHQICYPFPSGTRAGAAQYGDGLTLELLHLEPAEAAYRFLRDIAIAALQTHPRPKHRDANALSAG